MTLEQIASEVRRLSVEQRKQLIAVIVETLIEDKPARTQSILEFEGVGERLRTGEDAQEYVNRLRSDWDERP